MPRRKLQLENGKIYHIFNRSLIIKDLFIGKKISTRAKQSLKFYQYKDPPIKLSHYLASSKEKKKKFFTNLESLEKLVDILTYSLITDHFHLILEQKSDGGISKFMSLFQNSLTRYVNNRFKRKGNIFIVQFGAIRIEEDEILKKLHRYIHQEPLIAGLVKTQDELKHYDNSSVKEYISGYQDIVNIEPVATKFENKEDYLSFIFDTEASEESIPKIKYLIFD